VSRKIALTVSKRVTIQEPIAGEKNTASLSRSCASWVWIEHVRRVERIEPRARFGDGSRGWRRGIGGQQSHARQCHDALRCRLSP
jgi:hypothetical protein